MRLDIHIHCRFTSTIYDTHTAYIYLYIHTEVVSPFLLWNIATYVLPITVNAKAVMMEVASKLPIERAERIAKV